MFEELFSDEVTRRRHRNAPFANERERYLRHCASLGGTRATLRSKSTTLLWLSSHLEPSASEGIGLEQLQKIAQARQSIYNGATTARRLIDIARPWLRFLGWWRVPAVAFRFQHQLDHYVVWMRERGFSPLTIERWQAHARMFLQWCEQTGRHLSALQPGDIDHYFVSEGAGRAFLYAVLHRGCGRSCASRRHRRRAIQGWQMPYRVRDAIPGWNDVRRILADTGTNTSRDVRDRAILMLLAIYGLRRGEVASLRLDQIDWRGRALRIFRLKRRQPQVYPLLPSVAEALASYVDTVRPHAPCPEVFIRLQAPWGPITPSSIYNIVNRKFVALGIHVPHRGPHALRHACAARLVTDGLTLKEIGDHLGHRSTVATRIYAKADIRSLREVGDFDLGDLQ